MSKGKTIKCPNCETDVLEDDNFCKACGFKLRGVKSAGQSNKQNLLSSRLVYIFSAVLILLVILVIFLNRNSDKKIVAQPGPAAEAQAMGDLPLIDHQRISELKVKVERNPKDANNLIALANTLHDSNLQAEAIEYYKKYLAINEKDPDARVDMGVCYHELGDNKTAIMIIEEAIKYSPKHQKAYFNLGIINLKEGNLQKANEYFKKCYELDTATPTGMQAKEIMDQHQNLKSKNK